MANNNVKHRPPSTRAGKHLNNREKTEICQYRDMGWTIAKIAKKFKCAYATVEYTLRVWAAQNPEEVKLARANALVAMSAIVGRQAKRALTAITDDALTHDRVEVRDPITGNIVAVNHSGATAVQLASMADRFLERQDKMQDKAADIIEEIRVGGNKDQTAAGVKALMDSIIAQADGLQINVDFVKDMRVEVEDAKFEDITDGEESPTEQ